MPYGYRNEDGKMVIVPEQAEIVRWIFDQVLSGKSMLDIAREMNARGLSTVKGRPWSNASISYMIRNEKYVGDAMFQKTYIDENFCHHYNYGERDQYYVKNHHEAIVSREVFDAANALIKLYGREKGCERNGEKSKLRYVTSGKVLCGECGGRMRRRKLSHGYGFGCSTHLDNKDACTMKPVREDAVRAAFMTMMNKLTYARGTILVPYMDALKRKSGEDSSKRIEEIEALLKKNEERKTLMKEFFAGRLLDSAVYEKERNILVEEERRLKAEKESLTSGIGEDSNYKDALTELLKHTSKADMATEFDEQLFEKHVDHIVIYSRTEIGFVMKCGLEFRERI